MSTIMGRPGPSREADARAAPRAPVRLAVVGCGAVAEKVYLPVLDRLEGGRVAVLVDRDEDRAERLAAEFGVPRASGEYRGLGDEVDGAVVALPHHLHAPAATELLEAGVHVLVEKPMALTVEGCDRMIEAARAGDRVLAVGHVRRLYDASRFVREALRSGALGRPVEFDYREGSVYDWDVASDFMFRREAGGGVLADTGSHALDLLLWWFGDVREVAYRDDAMGGVEAECELELVFASGVRGTVELSRRRDLRNTCRIRTEEAELELGVGFDPQVRLRPRDLDASLRGRVGSDGGGRTSMGSVFEEQLEGFLEAIATGGTPPVPGEEGREVVALLEECRRIREPLELPWLQPEVSRPETSGPPR